MLLQLDIVLICGLTILVVLMKSTNQVHPHVKSIRRINLLLFFGVALNLLSVLFSADIYRSFLFFIVGMIGPILISFLLINKTRVNQRNLDFFLFSFIVSGIVVVLIAFFMLGRQIGAGETGFLSALDAYCFSYCIGLLFYLMKLEGDGIVPDTGTG